MGNPYEECPVCDVCGHDPIDCICPGCPQCLEQGNPECKVNKGPGCDRRSVNAEGVRIEDVFYVTAVVEHREPVWQTYDRHSTECFASIGEAVHWQMQFRGAKQYRIYEEV